MLHEVQKQQIPLDLIENDNVLASLVIPPGNSNNNSIDNDSSNRIGGGDLNNNLIKSNIILQPSLLSFNMKELGIIIYI